MTTQKTTIVRGGTWPLGSTLRQPAVASKPMPDVPQVVPQKTKIATGFEEQISRILELSKSTNNVIHLYFSNDVQFISPDLENFRVEEYDSTFVRVSCNIGEKVGTLVIDRNRIIGAMLLKS